MSDRILSVTVSCQGQEDVVFKIKDDTPLKKLMERYCTQVINKKAKEVVFTYEGIEVNGDDTPKALKMKSNDVVSVTIMQVGGAAG